MHKKLSALEKIRLLEDPNARFLNDTCILSHCVKGLHSVYKIYQVTERGVSAILAEPELRVLHHDMVSVIKERPSNGTSYKASVIYKIPSLEIIAEMPLRDVLYYDNNTVISTLIANTGMYQYGIQIAKGYNGEIIYNDNSLPVYDTLIFKYKEWVLLRNTDKYLLLNSKTQKIISLFGGRLLLGTHSVIITSKILRFGMNAEAVNEDYSILILNFDNNTGYNIKRNTVRMLSKAEITKDSWVDGLNSVFFTRLVHDIENQGVHLKALMSKSYDISLVDLKNGVSSSKVYKKGNLLIEDIYTKYIGRE